MSDPIEFPELSVSRTDRELRNLKRKSSEPFHIGMVLLCIAIILTSAFCVFQSAMLILSPQIVANQQRSTMIHVGGRKTSRSKESTQQQASELFQKAKQHARFDFMLGLVKLPLSLTLIVSTFLCFFRMRLARGLTRWCCLIAALLTIIQYGAFGYAIWSTATSGIMAIKTNQLLTSLGVAAIIGFGIVTVYFSAWNVFNFPPVRRIFRE